MITRLTTVLAALVLLGACSLVAEGADTAWTSTKRGMCDGQSTGALFRNLETQAKMNAYLTFCDRLGEKPRITVP